MKTVRYGLESFTTSDEIADALLMFAADLRGSDSGQLLNVPVLDERGESGTISIVVAHGIPMISRPSVSEFPDPDAAEIIDRMRRLASRHGPLRPNADAARDAGTHSPHEVEPTDHEQGV